MYSKLYQSMRAKQNVVALFCTAILLPFLVTTIQVGFHSSTSVHSAAIQPQTTTLLDLADVQKTIALNGNLAAYGNQTAIQELVFTIRNVAENKPLSLAQRDFVINYRDPYQRVSQVNWFPQFHSQPKTDQQLESGELVEIRIPIASLLQHPLGANTPFVVDVVPAQGVILTLERTTPSKLGPALNFG